MALVDNTLKFSAAQVITSSASSTNTVNLGPFGGNAKRAISNNRGIPKLLVHVDTAFTSTGSSTLQIKLVTDDADTFGSAVTLVDSGAIAKAALSAGAIFLYELPAGPVFEQYNKLTYTVAVADFDTGKLNAYVVFDVTRWQRFASGFSTGV